MSTIIDAMTVVEIYTEGDEEGRMAAERNFVEWQRTCELLARWMPPPPATVFDVGGGPGRYACHLIELGYDVTLYDLVPKHIEQAAARGITAYLADARNLPAADTSAQIVVCLGPAYHLPQADDRAAAFAEAFRVCEPTGRVIVAALSRWARPLVRAAQEQLGDENWHQHTLTALREGHVADGDGWDRVAYLHTPGELAGELRTAGFTDVEVLGIEGPIGPWARLDPTLNQHAAEIARAAELNAGASIHMLACATKPALA